VIRTSGKVHGKVIRWVPAATTDRLVFPIGKTGNTNPAYIQFTEAPTTGGTLTSEFVTELPANYYGNLPLEADGIIIDNLADDGFWRIEAGDGLNGGTYSITLESGAIEQILIPANVRILKRPTGSSDWSVIGSFSYSGTEFTHSGITDFSEFALGGDFSENPMPIELLFFTAEKADNHVKLNWATASEINNDYFTVERSADLRDIASIAEISGAGNSNITCLYEYLDYQPLNGINYYRLKQTDYDGSFDFSDWVAVNVNNITDDLRIVYLKQEVDLISIGIEATPGTSLHISAVDLFGRVIHSEKIVSEQSFIKYSFKPQGLSGKMLIIRVNDDKNAETRKVFYK
jgi:hypothetical protein